MRDCATLPEATVPSGRSQHTAEMPARAAYAAAEDAVFPVEATITVSAPSSTAFDTATVMPRSLYEPVGLDASHFNQTSRAEALRETGRAEQGRRAFPERDHRGRSRNGETIAEAVDQRDRHAQPSSATPRPEMTGIALASPRASGKRPDRVERRLRPDRPWPRG